MRGTFRREEKELWVEELGEEELGEREEGEGEGKLRTCNLELVT